jgi:hypothetical protein
MLSLTIREPIRAVVWNAAVLQVGRCRIPWTCVGLIVYKWRVTQTRAEVG